MRHGLALCKKDRRLVQREAPPSVLSDISPTGEEIAGGDVFANFQFLSSASKEEGWQQAVVRRSPHSWWVEEWFAKRMQSNALQTNERPTGQRGAPRAAFAFYVPRRDALSNGQIFCQHKTQQKKKPNAS
jgi:hypothetical protein